MLTTDTAFWKGLNAQHSAEDKESLLPLPLMLFEDQSTSLNLLVPVSTPL